MSTVDYCVESGKSSLGVRWDRLEYSKKIESCEQLSAEGLSERKIAKSLAVSRSTLRDWKNHRDTLDASPELVKFFESSHGLAFLHRLTVSAHLVFVEAGACGVSMISKFMQLISLDRYIASSEEAQRKINVVIEKAIVNHGASESARLAEAMPAKEITACQDETFTGGLCLVAIEPESGYIILEKTAEDRTCETWAKHMDKAMMGMNATIIQSTSDEARALVAYATKHLGVAHSPDVFHVQHELSRAVSAPVAAKVRAAERAVKVAQDNWEASKAEQAAAVAASSRSGPGRPKNHAQHCNNAAAQLAAEEAEHARLQKLQESLRDDVRAIGTIYHPIDLQTGGRLSSSLVVSRLEEKIEHIRELAEQEGLSESSFARIAKAKRVLPQMGLALDFVSSHTRKEFNKLDLSASLVRALHTKLLPAAYLERIAQKKGKHEGQELREKANKLKEPLYAPSGLLCDLSEIKCKAVEKRVNELARLFQRSSSCVEGRNGVLSFRHHELHKIGERKRQVLTVLHNFFITRRDKTTAAERFFENKPLDLFQTILDAIDIPARPLSPPRRQKNLELYMVK